MPRKQPKLREDMAETARRVFLESIGEAPRTLPPSERTEKNANAVKRGAKGGRRGGKARAEKLSSEERSQIAQNAARKRWGKDAE